MSGIGVNMNSEQSVAPTDDGSRSLSAGAMPPGSWLGLLGGGQLGRMFCMAAQSLGYRVAVLDPGSESPAGSVADLHVQADYDDATALERLAGMCAAVTTEFENVPAGSLAWLADHCVVSPAAACVAIAQDRLAEKRFIENCGIGVAPYAAVLQAAEIDQVADDLFPGILKVSRLGYDGKGQVRVANREQARAAFDSLDRAPCVLEKRLALDYELSVVLARGFDGACAVYPVSENVHRDGILARSTVPAQSPDASLSRIASEAALNIARRLDYIGVLCVEFFVTADGSLLVNEIAPRPHNSGHYSIDACITSQFEQQARILARLPLGSVRQHSPAVMLNLLGDLWFQAGAEAGLGTPVEPDWAALLAQGDAKLHLYGKREPRPGRKMGHVTIAASSAEAAEAGAVAASAALNIEP